MRQLIPFKKDIPFKTKVSQINSISLEHTLKLTTTCDIEGDFILEGDYKINDISINLEPFNYIIPFEIALAGNFDDTLKISIADFYYEIVNDESLRVNIDVLIEGEEKAIIENQLEETNIDELPEVINEIEMPKAEETAIEEELLLDKRCVEDEDVSNTEIKSFDETINNVIKEEIRPENVNSNKNILEILNSEETFVTYHVHIIQEGDTIDEIITKYKTTKEEISLYNDLENFSKGNKIIIPTIKNNETTS